MKSNKGLKEWLIDENIELETNDLEDIRGMPPTRATVTHPREDATQIITNGRAII
jgi:hypothetical protein